MFFENVYFIQFVDVSLLASKNPNLLHKIQKSPLPPESDVLRRQGPHLNLKSHF